MCPPRQCCCCDIYQGVRTWCIVFIILSAVFAVGSFAGAGAVTAYCEDSDDWNEDKFQFCFGDDFWETVMRGEQVDEDDYQYKQIALALIVSGIVNVINLGVCIFGFCAVNNFHARNIKYFWIVEAILAGLNLINGLRTPDQYLGAMITFGLSMWWVVAVKSLGDQIQQGIITRENPLGNMGAATGIQMQPVVQPQGVPIVAQATVVTAQATAVPVQGQVVVATTQKP